MKRVLIADDHAAVRSGLRAVLEQRPGLAIVAEASDGCSAVAAALQHRPDIAIVDFLMPGMTGVEVTRRIKTHLPDTEVLIFTMQDSTVLAQEAFEAGARAILLKSDTNKSLLSAVEAMIARRPFISEKCPERHRQRDRTAMASEVRLSPRERIVIKLVAEGNSNKTIGALLSSSVKTIETHRSAAMSKIGVNSIAGLVRYAIKADLIDP